MIEYVTKEILRKNVTRGAAFLDENVPGWRARIDLENLALASPCDCILWQLFNNDYILASETLNLDWEDRVEFGFTLPTAILSEGEGHRWWRTLDNLWKEELR